MKGEDSRVLYDDYGRPVTNVRISVNSSLSCNFRCIFCHLEGINVVPKSMMTPEEIQHILRIMSDFGVETVKLTGGEPMLRSDIVEIVERIRALDVKEISMTTNGTRLEKMASTLKVKGLDRVNISLHSLRKDRYAFITGSNNFDGVLKAIHAAVNAELTPVKLNTTMLKGVNEDEVEDLINFTASLGGGETVILQLIELVPSDWHFYRAYHMKLDKIEEGLKRRAVKITSRRMHSRLKYHLPNNVAVELVTPIHNSTFCMGNNRIRITYDGQFKPCLLRDDNHVDFLTAIRRGASDEEIVELFKKAVKLREPFYKPERVEEKAVPLTAIAQGCGAGGF